MYHWTLDYCLDSLTLQQVFYFHKRAAVFNNPELENKDKPDKAKFKEVYGNRKKVTR